MQSLLLSFRVPRLHLLESGLLATTSLRAYYIYFDDMMSIKLGVIAMDLPSSVLFPRWHRMFLCGISGVEDYLLPLMKEEGKNNLENKCMDFTTSMHSAKIFLGGKLNAVLASSKSFGHAKTKKEWRTQYCIARLGRQQSGTVLCFWKMFLLTACGGWPVPAATFIRTMKGHFDHSKYKSTRQRWLQLLYASVDGATTQ